jgi:hypothetical protein
MTRLGTIPRHGLRSGRWLLPLLAVLLAWAVLEFATTSAFGGGASTTDRSKALHSCIAVDDGAVHDAGVDWWIVAEARRAACSSSR